MKVVVLSKTDTAEIVEHMKSKWPSGTIPKIKNFKSYEVDASRQFLVADDLYCVKISSDTVIPFLGDIEMLGKFPSVTVDMGAVKFVCNGANILRPGIVSFDTFSKGNIVVVKDQQHQKVLAVGIALEDSDSAKLLSKGNVVENLHYISDKIWELAKEIKSMNP